jgi:hypothetical protein
LAYTIFRSNRIHVWRAQGDKQVAVSVLMIGERAQMSERWDRALAIVIIESGAIAIATNAKTQTSETNEKIIIAIDTRNERAG